MLETCNLPVVGVAPCSCDILAAEGKCLFASEKPNYPFTKTLQEIAANLLIMKGCPALSTSKPLKLKIHAGKNAAPFPPLK